MMMVRGLVVALLSATPLLLQAHHSVALNFSEEVMSLEGAVSGIRWVNPHASFVLEVTNDDGTTDKWLVELLARVALERRGFDFDALQEGTQIQLTGRVGYREHTLFFEEAVLPNGRIVVTRRSGP